MSQTALTRDILALALRAGELNEPALETALLCSVRLLQFPRQTQGLIVSTHLMSFLIADSVRSS